MPAKEGEGDDDDDDDDDDASVHGPQSMRTNHAPATITKGK
jgi:hypothetical protein